VTAFSNGPLAAGELPSGDDSPVVLPDVVIPGGGAAAAAGLALADLDTSPLEIAEPDDAPLDGAEADTLHTPDESGAGDLPDGDLLEPGRPSHLRVAPEVERGLFHGRRRAQLLVFGVAVVSAASMFLLVTFHVFAAQSAFALNKLDTTLTKEQRDYGLLRDKVATLSSPDAVASRAKDLGMVRSTEVTQLHPLSAPAFSANESLPVPPPTPYPAIDNTGH